jgi:nitroimidazol reductase NimA-like FMN-containing flavoprotein (pyridoxamine 5'-phosphate oxidase superfamily)
VEATYEQTRRTKGRRQAARVAHDRGTVHAILDEALVGHLGVTTDDGPRVIPTTYARVGEAVFVHGAVSNHVLRHAADAPVCFTVTLLDGLVLARSAFHHSMNYRSVVVYGTPAKVVDPDLKRRALDAIVDRVACGRSAEARPPTDAELRATMVLELDLKEVSAKVRTGGPIDDEADLDWPVWAGVIPLRTVTGDPQPA